MRSQSLEPDELDLPDASDFEDESENIKLFTHWFVVARASWICASLAMLEPTNSTSLPRRLLKAASIPATICMLAVESRMPHVSTLARREARPASLADERCCTIEVRVATLTLYGSATHWDRRSPHSVENEARSPGRSMRWIAGKTRGQRSSVEADVNQQIERRSPRRNEISE